MRLEDAPPAGWYPDPEQGERLRWWEGADWADEWRAPPSAGEIASARRPDDESQRAQERRTLSPPDQFRDRASETEEMVTQVREAAREEVARAATELTRRAQSTFGRYSDAATGFLRRVWRWTRAAIVLAAVLVVTWYVLQFIAQAAFLDWIGDRLDNLFAD